VGAKLPDILSPKTPLRVVPMPGKCFLGKDSHRRGISQLKFILKKKYELS
jgi:hypothetical protein